jgi:hypothetical protein
MLKCVDHEREARARRIRAHYRRRKRGARCVSVEIDTSVINFLEKMQWLASAPAHDAKAIAAAIKACLELSAKI